MKPRAASLVLLAAALLVLSPCFSEARRPRGAPAPAPAPASSTGSPDDTRLTLNFVQVTEDKGSLLETARNPAYNSSVAALLLNRGTLAPCGVRVQHLHRGVDELYFAVSGAVGVAAADPAGNILNQVLSPGQSFVIPAAWIHTVYNPDCTERAVFMSFLNAFDSATSNSAKAAFNMNAGPFQAYADPDRLDSLNNAVGLLAFDPTCLARCNLGAQGGQEPVSVA